MADDRAGAGVLLRLFERRPVALMPFGLRPAGVPRERLARLRRGEREVRRGCGRRIHHRQSGAADPGLSLRSVAAAHPRKNSQGHHRAVLAHPVAERRDVRRVSVEARDVAAHAFGRHPRFSHALPLPEFPRFRGSLRGVPDRS